MKAYYKNKKGVELYFSNVKILNYPALFSVCSLSDSQHIPENPKNLGLREEDWEGGILGQVEDNPRDRQVWNRRQEVVICQITTPVPKWLRAVTSEVAPNKGDPLKLLQPSPREGQFPFTL